MLKYEMIPEDGMFRVKALKDFGVIKTGEIGGLIEREGNLSQAGNAWIFGNARVHEYARVSGNAEVSGDVRVYGDARVFGNARIYGNAKVFGYVQVCGDARVFGNAKVSSSPICISGLLWHITIADEHIQIGCKVHLKTEWRDFTDEQISALDPRALDFWTKNKGLIMLAAR